MVKFFFAIFSTIITITLIGFIGNKAIVAEELDKDAVVIEVAAKVEDKTKAVMEEPIEGSSDIVQAEQAPASFTDLLINADLKRGQKLFNKCAACHSFKKDGKHKIGPNLWNIVGLEKAAKEGFKYSKAMKSAGGDWDYNSLDQFILKPKKFILGTKMGFAGIKNIEDRATLIAWLRTQADTALPLPGE